MIVDTHPGFGVLTRVGIAAATDVLIPTTPGYWELQGVDDTLDWVEETHRSLGLNGRGPRVYGVILTMLDRADAPFAEFARRES